MTRVLILGSCVSRDAFVDSSCCERGLSVVDYYARSSLASLSSLPVPQVFDLSLISSPFQRRMVERDLTKQFWSDIRATEYDVLLLDFVDDRLGLLSAGDFRFTDSNEFRAARVPVPADSWANTMPYSDQFFVFWEMGWVRLLSSLRELGLHNRLLINKVYWAYLDELGKPFESVKYIDGANDWLRKIYLRVGRDLAPRQFVDYSGVPFIGNSTHKWGRSPFHFYSSIEQRLLDSVKLFHAAAS